MAVASGIPFVHKHMTAVWSTIRGGQTPCTRPRSRPSSSSASRVIARRRWHRQCKVCPKAMSPGLALQRLLPTPPPPSPPRFILKARQSFHAVFIRLETRVGYAYNHHIYVEQKGREYTFLTKALFDSEPPRAHPIVKPNACSYASMEFTNDRDDILWHAKTGGYCPEGGSVNRTVRSWKAEKAYIQRSLFLPRKLL